MMKALTVDEASGSSLDRGDRVACVPILRACSSRRRYLLSFLSFADSAQVG